MNEHTYEPNKETLYQFYEVRKANISFRNEIKLNEGMEWSAGTE